VLREQPDYVLLDVKMPALSGGELAQLLHRKQTLASTAVVLHSSMDAEELKVLARNAGALGSIKKSPNAMLFLAEFERLVAQHRAGGAER
jgi:DNA-binding response OmpR family regulator